MNMKDFFTLHRNLPREGPGSDATTKKAIARLPLESVNRAIDMGCGPGRQSVVLASELDCPVTALDLHAPFVDQLRDLAKKNHVDHLIDARVADMMALETLPQPVDLIWSEGAIYFPGFEAALRAWKSLLTPDGVVAVSEAVWLKNDPPKAARDFWTEYPDLTDVNGCIERAERAGYRVVDHFILPKSDWWTEYYTPMLERVAQLRPDASASLNQILDEATHEADIHRRFGDWYSYVFFIMTRA